MTRTDPLGTVAPSAFLMSDWVSSSAQLTLSGSTFSNGAADDLVVEGAVVVAAVRVAVVLVAAVVPAVPVADPLGGTTVTDPPDPAVPVPVAPVAPVTVLVNVTVRGADVDELQAPTARATASITGTIEVRRMVPR
ncbi:hypothetical protein GCM10011594_08300 [Nakamurella endophytica]|uniref:Uncharacterized protein n=1 Tax=Nakamurella endophytica TaxID=1748367 RepID=A0A917SRA8_9ACTN|nr:hypothetical protein GCM10011594_08300 [Nakamurella endophytica]